jgi:seryl-tRNA synthetase
MKLKDMSIDELIAIIEKGNTDLKELEANSLKTVNALKQENVTLQNEKKGLLDENANLKKSYSELETNSLAQIEALKKEVLAKKDFQGNPSVVVDDEEYEIIVQKSLVKRQGIKIELTAQEIADDEDLCRELVAKRSGIIVKKA